ncbi:MAG: lysophospholipid acyltransferase family protein [Candidatus Thorarchaeota archaeon]
MKKVKKKLSLKELKNLPIPLNEIHVQRWSFFKRFSYRFAKLTIPQIFEKLFDFEIKGFEYLKDFTEGKPIIFCGNHRSHLDSIILGSAVVRTRQFLAFMASGKAMDKFPIFKSLKRLGAFPVYRENPEPALKYAEISLKAGLAVAIFPEGKRTIYKAPNRGKTGVARVIERLNYEVPVIPFYIHGSSEVLSIGRKLPRFGHYISIEFGSPIYFQTYENIKNSYERLRKITDTILLKISELLKNSETDYLSKIENSLVWPTPLINKPK